MRKLSLLSRMRTCGRRRPLSGPIPCNATVRILLRAHPSATPAPNGGMRPSGTHAAPSVDAAERVAAASAASLAARRSSILIAKLTRASAASL